MINKDSCNKQKKNKQKNIYPKGSYTSCYFKLLLHLSKDKAYECMYMCVYMFGVHHSGNILDTLLSPLYPRITIFKSNIFMAHPYHLCSL